jgi:hypothetical protein
LNQGSGPQLIQWASDISPGPFESTQLVTFAVTCDPLTPTLFTVPPTMTAGGLMKMTLADLSSGVTTCTVTCSDDGGRANGGQDTTTAAFRLTVRHINQPPTYTAGADYTMLEREKVDDATVILSWASNINVGPSNPSSLTLEFEVVPADASWFKIAPRIDPNTGAMTFTLVPYVNGVTTLKHRLKNSGSSTSPDNNISPYRTMQLVVQEVNQAPRFALGPNVQVLQNSGTYRYQAWATSIAAGPSFESAQTLTFTLMPTTKEIFTLPPTIDPATGDLMFSTATNRAGSTPVTVCLSDNGGVENGGIDNLCKTITIAVLAVNQAPTATNEPEVSVLQNAGAITLPSFLKGVTAGPDGTDRSQQITAITLSVPLGQRSLFTTLPTVTLDTYTLTFQMAPEATGTITVTTTITDNGGTANGGVDRLVTTFLIRVLSVNQRPTFTAGAAVAVLQGSGAYYGLWATDVSPGLANEVQQALQFTVVVDRPTWFAAGPAVNALGYLSFTLQPNVYGTVSMTVTLKDGGGTANGGTDTSMPVTSSITITFVNQAPTFTAGPDLSIFQNMGPYSYAAWATDILAGPVLEDASQHAGLSFAVEVADRTMFSVLPRVDLATGTLSLTTAPTRSGDTTFTVTLKDSAGTANGGKDTSVVRTVTLRVRGVNQAPSFTATGDVTVMEDSGDQVVMGWITDVSAGPNEDATQSTSFVISVTNAALFASPPRIVGRDLYFTPAANVFGDSVLTVNVTDNGGTAYGGVNTFARTFLLTVMSVNDIPTFTPGADVTVVENSGITRIEKWLTAYSTGATNEAAQKLTAKFTLNRNDVLLDTPTLDMTTGALTFEPQLHAFGTVVVSMSLMDDGGVARGGVAESVVKTFRIIITPINDAPTFIPGLPVLVVSNVIGEYSLPWATNISAGPREDSQTVAFEVTTPKPELFTTSGQPRLTPSGVLSFTVVAGARGNTTLSVTLRDSDNGRSTTSYVTLFVTALNANTLVTMTLNAAYDGFNVEQFRTIVAEELGVDRSQIVVLRVERGSVRVTFQVLGTANGESSDALTQRLVTSAQNPGSSLSTRLALITVSTQQVDSAAQPSPTGRGSSKSDSGVNYVALGVGLGVGLLVLVIVVVAVVVFIRRREERKRQAKFRTAAKGYNGPYEYEDKEQATGKDANPIPHTFEDQRYPTVPDYYDDGTYTDDGYAFPPKQAPSTTKPAQQPSYFHTPSRRQPTAFVPVRTPPTKIYAQPSPRRSRWPAARDVQDY